jgi:transposase
MPATEFRTLVKQGWNEAEIATRFGVSEAAVAIRRTVLGL